MIERYTLQRMGSVWKDEVRFKKMLDIEIFICEALSREGMIPKKALDKIKARAKFDIKRIQEIEKRTHHDVVAFLEAVSENVGEEAKFIHMGVTSSDILDTASSLQLKEAADILLDDLGDLALVLKKRAKQYKNTIMMGRTHGVHAEPITFGLKLALWYSETLRNIQRMERAREIISVGKISGAVGTYAHLDPEVEEYVCKKLGLKPESISTQIIQRDRYAEYMSILAIAGASLEKFASEIRHLQRTEVGEVEEYFAPGQKGSSSMPHKRNPITCERICGLARIVRGNLQAALENVNLWHERDISHSSVERVILPDSTILLDYMLIKFTQVIKNLKVNEKRMEKNLQVSKDAIFSQKVLLEMLKKGLSREKAYSIVQKASHGAMAKAESFQTLLRKEGVMSQKEIYACFNIKNYIRNVDKIFKKVGI
ncbi:adenylosuccinate lyase [bacterium]|nr:adenylosuccinate lyase [bacterium]